MIFSEKLKQAVQSSQSCLCVGLDPNLALLPEPIKRDKNNTEQVVTFLKKVIDITRDYCAAYKPNLGFFESLGADGLKVFHEIIDYIPSQKIIIADAKRGDISSTAEHYAKAYFEMFDVDAITLSPLMGFETLAPFLNYPNKSIYTLTLTSNPGARDFLMKPFTNFSSMAEYIASNLATLQENNSTHLGMVIGATKTDEIAPVIQHHPEASLLIPGIGTQGGSIDELKHLLQKHRGIPLINSSRSILYAGKNRTDWDVAVADQAKTFKRALKPITDSYV